MGDVALTLILAIQAAVRTSMEKRSSDILKKIDERLARIEERLERGGL